MTESERTHLIWIGALAAVVILLWYLWYSVNNPAAAAGTLPGTGTTPTVLGQPPSQITLAFQNPASNFTNQATGYVPLFGFIGYGGYGFG